MSDVPNIPLTSHHYVEADGINVFYREAGPANAPVVLLLHGFPTSSFQYRELIPCLADRYHVIAPDLPGFGFTLTSLSSRPLAKYSSPFGSGSGAGRSKSRP